MTFGGRDGVGRAVVSLFTFGGRKKSGEIGRKKSDFWREILTKEPLLFALGGVERQGAKPLMP